MARYSNDTVIILDTNGNPITGAYTYFYQPGTTTLKSIYSDEDLLITQANPVRTLSGGILPEIFIDGLYAVKQNDADDVALYPTQDPVGEIIAGQFEAYNSADTYAINEIVLATNGEYYISLVGSNQGNEPSVSASQWQFIPVKDMVGLTETQTLTNKTLTSPVLNTSVSGTAVLDEDDMATDSATQLATQQSIKAYVDAASVVQVVNVQDGAVATGTTVIPEDNTIPQNTEGDEYMTLAITPTLSTNKLKIDVVVNLSSSSATFHMIGALFQDSTASALAAMGSAKDGAGGTSGLSQVCFTHYMTAGTATSTTFKVRAGCGSAGTTTFNGLAGIIVFGGVMASSITITEIKA